MSRRAPAEKLPLAVRKNVRDNWENVREEWEKKISDVLGESWTIKIDPLAIYAYAEPDSWAQSSLGDTIAGYVAGAERQLKYFIESNGDGSKAEINQICSAHVLTMDYDEDKKVSYCGCKVSSSGELVVLFSEGNLGSNIDYALEGSNLTKALNEAPSSGDEQSMSYTARTSISKDYEPEISRAQEKLNKILGQEIAIVPNFEGNFAKLKAGKNVRDDFESNLGSFTRLYFEALNSYLENEKFGEDEMLQEGLLEAVEGRAVHFRIVDETKRSYNETVIEGGILYLQTTPDNFGTNIDYVSSELVSLL
ncbi:hypothetical protein ACJ41O_000620 [Fusarium nematophilum]